MKRIFLTLIIVLIFSGVVFSFMSKKNQTTDFDVSSLQETNLIIESDSEKTLNQFTQTETVSEITMLVSEIITTPTTLTTLMTTTTTTTTTKKVTTTTSVENNITTTTTKNELNYNKNNLTSYQNEIYNQVLSICKNYPNVEPAMVMAIIERESNFNSYAINYNGTCHGLMQIYIYYNQDRINKLGVTDIYDPYSNILIGVDLLNYLYNYYGNWEESLCHYSGGSESYYNLIIDKMPKYKF